MRNPAYQGLPLQVATRCGRVLRPTAPYASRTRPPSRWPLTLNRAVPDKCQSGRAGRPRIVILNSPAAVLSGPGGASRGRPVPGCDFTPARPHARARGLGLPIHHGAPFLAVAAPRFRLAVALPGRAGLGVGGLLLLHDGEARAVQGQKARARGQAAQARERRRHPRRSVLPALVHAVRAAHHRRRLLGRGRRGPPVDHHVLLGAHVPPLVVLHGPPAARQRLGRPVAAPLRRRRHAAGGVPVRGVPDVASSCTTCSAAARPRPTASC